MVIQNRKAAPEEFRFFASAGCADLPAAGPFRPPCLSGLFRRKKLRTRSTTNKEGAGKIRIAIRPDLEIPRPSGMTPTDRMSRLLGLRSRPAAWPRTWVSELGDRSPRHHRRPHFSIRKMLHKYNQQLNKYNSLTSLSLRRLPSNHAGSRQGHPTFPTAPPMGGRSSVGRGAPEGSLWRSKQNVPNLDGKKGRPFGAAANHTS